MGKIYVRKVQTLSWNDQAMHKFLTTNQCRRTEMSKYLNGEEYEVNCETLQAELCDNCKSNLSYTAMGKRRLRNDEELEWWVKHRQSNERQQSDLQASIMDEEQQLE